MKINALISLVFFSLLFANATAAKKDAQNSRVEGQAFLEANRLKNSVTTTRSGLQYETLVEVDSDQHPRGNDTLEIHYHGTFIDGTVFDSSIERGQPIDIKLWDAIPGWTEGLKLMSPGDKYRFYIPSRLGYGRTRKDNIPPHSVLIFEIEFLANKAKRNSKRKKK